MRVLIRYFLRLTVLVLSMAGLWACSNTTATKFEPSKGNYPPAPPNLMQANLKKINGSNFKLDDYRGKVILVNVWTTWCGPCRQEIPELIKLQTEYKTKGFEIIGLNLDEDAETIKPFNENMKINYDLATGDRELFEEFFNVSKKDAIPQSFLINREGKLLGVFVGGGGALKRLIEGVNKVMAE